MDMNKENVRHDWTPLRPKGFPRTVHSSSSHKTGSASPAPIETATARTRRDPLASVTILLNGSDSTSIGSNSTPGEENHCPSMTPPVPSSSRANRDEPTRPPAIVEIPTTNVQTDVESDSTRVISPDVPSATTEPGEESDGSSATVEQPLSVGSEIFRDSKRDNDTDSGSTECPSLFSAVGIDTAVPATGTAHKNDPYHNEPEETTDQQCRECFPLFDALVSGFRTFFRRGFTYSASPSADSHAGVETAVPVAETQQNDPYHEEQEGTTDQKCCVSLPIAGIAGVMIAQACAIVGGACGHVATAASIGLTGLTFAVTRQEINRKLSEIKDDITEMKGDVTGLKDDSTEMKGDITGLKDDSTEMKGDITGLKDDITEMKGDITGLKAVQERQGQQLDTIIDILQKHHNT